MRFLNQAGQRVIKASLARAMVLTALASGGLAVPAYAQSSWHPETPTYTPPPSAPLPPSVQVSQPPVIQINPPIRIIPTIPIRPDVPRNTPLPVNPRDLVGTPISMENDSTPTVNVLKGLSPMQEQKFPASDEMFGPTDSIVIKLRPNSEFAKLTEYSLELSSGQLLVSVRRPSRMALLECTELEVAVAADSDVLFTRENGVVRIANLTGLNDAVKVKLKQPAEGGTGTKVFSVKPGYEFIIKTAGQLKKIDVRTADGIARRHFCFLENGHAAIAEISVESMLKDCDLIAQLDQESSGVKEKRILTDMSKMAAVLNYVNGGAGYRSEGQVTLEVNSTIAQPAKTN